jgi:voltage-gated potassium channel
MIFMKEKFHYSEAARSTMLLISLIFAVFVLPVLPGIWQKTLFRIAYTFIYFTAILSLEKRSIYLLLLLAATIVTEWVSGILNLAILLGLAKLVNILFFIVIVVMLIRQIAISRKVSAGIIIDAIAGYLLIGVIFSIVIMFIMQYDSGSFSYNQSQVVGSEQYLNKSVPLYYSFITLASVGYGDIVPLKPYTRSIATFIAVSGQFYIAIIVALLVGKFSSQNNALNGKQ